MAGGQISTAQHYTVGSSVAWKSYHSFEEHSLGSRPVTRRVCTEQAELPVAPTSIVVSTNLSAQEASEVLIAKPLDWKLGWKRKSTMPASV